eukprot:TRINITY_DN15600_c0_g1_i1.p2 TRINITY_DN15600_c0_g1~~TRINITY_DN15600_c0_g1_i1.p2  ORF type:complete len:60 (-),score=5.10 TRINITY_DN15600_c0_g1_i1:75-254(-)
MPSTIYHRITLELHAASVHKHTLIACPFATCTFKTNADEIAFFVHLNELDSQMRDFDNF